MKFIVSKIDSAYEVVILKNDNVLKYYKVKTKADVYALRKHYGCL